MIHSELDGNRFNPVSSAAERNASFAVKENRSANAPRMRFGSGPARENQSCSPQELVPVPIFVRETVVTGATISENLLPGRHILFDAMCDDTGSQ